VSFIRLSEKACPAVGATGFLVKIFYPLKEIIPTLPQIASSENSMVWLVQEVME
jgi:hypothetical protein